MTPILFSIPDTAIYTWLLIGVAFSALFDGFARQSAPRPFSLKEWIITSIAWPYCLWNARRSLFALMIGR